MTGLPFDYAVRNLGRRPARTLLAGASAALVCALLVATTAFVRALSHTFSGAGRSEVAILLSTSAEGDVVRSAVPAGLGSVVAASVRGVIAASDEIHQGTNVRLVAQGEAAPAHPGFLRGVTPSAFLVHDALTLTSGALPGPGEVLVGRLAARNLGVDRSSLAIGEVLAIEGGEFRVSGHFAAPGTTLEAELWVPLDELRGLTQRSDASVTFVRLESSKQGRLDLFAKRRLDLELTMIPSTRYYADLAAYLGPIRSMAWAMAVLVAFAVLFGGMNVVGATVTDRLSELATLRTLGYTAPALARSIAAEALLVAAAGAALGSVLARAFVSGGGVRLAMSAVELEVDAVSLLAGFAGALLVSLIGTAPAAIRLSRLSIAVSLNET